MSVAHARAKFCTRCRAPAPRTCETLADTHRLALASLYSTALFDNWMMLLLHGKMERKKQSRIQTVLR